MLLISPYHPEAGFNVGNAMGRNKLIYALADYGLVVSAEHKKGGTWEGASEELKRKPGRPVFVRLGDSVPMGKRTVWRLAKLGKIHRVKSGHRSTRFRLDDLANLSSVEANCQKLCSRWSSSP